MRLFRFSPTVPTTSLVFGVSGQDGSYLARDLLALGHRVIGVCRNASSSHSFRNLSRLDLSGEFTLLSFDSCCEQSIMALLESFNPSYVYNLWGVSSVTESIKDPEIAYSSIFAFGLSLLNALKQSSPNTRLVQAGSIEIFDCQSLPIVETSLLAPLSPYAQAKASLYLATKYYRETYDMPVSTALLSNHESSLRPDTFVVQKLVRHAQLLSLGKFSKLRVGNLLIQRDWGLASDYVNAIQLMAASANHNDYIISTGLTVSLVAIVSYLSELSGVDLSAHIVQDTAFTRSSDVLVKSVLPALIHAELGWTAPHTVYDVVKSMFYNRV